MMHGEGFTPNADIRSHLKRPNGTEFPELPMLTDGDGKIEHEIDTLLLTARSPRGVGHRHHDQCYVECCEVRGPSGTVALAVVR